MKFKYVAVAGIVFLTAVTFFSCKGKKEQPEKSETVDVSYSDSTLPAVSLEADTREWQVVCGKTFTLGKCANGDILFTGNCASIFREKDRLADAAYITAYDDTAAGIMQDGTVRVIGKNRKKFAETTLWSDIADVCIGENFIIGLSNDGTVFTCGDDATGCNEAYGVKRVKAVAAGKNHFVTVFSDGSVSVYGSLKDNIDTNEWKDISEIACGDNSVIAVTQNGEVLNYNAEYTKDWSNIHSLQACGDAAAAITESGIISSNGLAEEIEDIGAEEHFSLSEFNLAVVKDDGSVVCVGDEDNLQCDVEWWRLGAEIKNGYITGFDSETKVEEAVRLIEKSYGKNVFITDDKKQNVTSEFVGTGMYAYDADGAEVGCVLIYGDVNGDGKITAQDSMQIEKYIAGTETLQGAYDKAAHVLHYLSEVGKPVQDDADAVKRKANGEETVIQHFRDGYAGDIEKYYKINQDTVGYIRVEGTQIDYPVMYGKNFFYNDHDAYRHHRSLGAPYALHSTPGHNNVILGHNARKSGSMFHGLHKIEDRGEKLFIFRNRVINVTIYHEYSSWELFAVYETPAEEPAATQDNNGKQLTGFSKEEIRKWIDGQISRSRIKLGVDVSTEDSLLTLYTCGDVYYSDPNSQSRLYLFFRRVG